MFGEKFYWSLANDVVSKRPEWGATCEEIYNWQLIHNFYESPATISEAINTINPIMNIINPRILIRIKANLTPRADKVVEHGFHRDVEPPIVGAITSILYLNTNNGYTMFENKKKVESVGNRLVTFPNYIKHTGVSQTNTKIRVTLNLNYLAKQ